MAQQQRNISITAPAFYGLNTEDSPFDQDTGFASVANNAVIDKYGRIGAREAFTQHTTAITVTLSANPSVVTETKQIYRMGQGAIDGVTEVLAIYGHKQYDANGGLLQEDYYIMQVEGTVMGALTYPSLTDSTALADAKIVAFNNALYVFSNGNAPLVFDGTTITKLSADGGYLPPQDDGGTIAAELNGDVVTSAYGRLWTSGVGDDYQTIYYSDLLNAAQWYDGKATPTDAQNTAGILQVNEYWPTGYDRIQNIVAHNGFLIVFGRNSILVYANAATGDPAGTDGIYLQDTITNIGLVSRDGIASTGNDILFVDDTGVRSLGRTIQEKSAPLGDLTLNVRGDISETILLEENQNISLFFIPNKNIAVCLFAGLEMAYVIETRAPSPTGGAKITRWTRCTFNRGMYIEQGDDAYTLLAGKGGTGCLEYADYDEWDGEDYLFTYRSNQLTFGDSVVQKFVKRVDFTIVSSFIETDAVVRWGYDGTIDYSATKVIDANPPALYGIAEYNVGVFGDGYVSTNRYRTNTKGSGATVTVEFEADINGNSCSIQEINIQTLLGRIY